MKRYLIKFKYADAMSNWKWRTQMGEFYGIDEEDAKRRCINVYGLGIGCEYEIISVEVVG